MADPIYPVPDTPVYDTHIRALQNSDPANANDIFNPLFSRLIENTHAVKLSKADVDLGNVSDADFKVKAQAAGVATFDENGKLPADMLPETDVSGAVSAGIQTHNADALAHAELMTGKASQSDLTAHTGDTAVHVTAVERAGWNAKADQTALNSHVSNATAHLTAAERTKWNAKGAPYRFTATIPTSGWSGSASAGYSITLAVEGVTENMTPTVDVLLSGTVAEMAAQLSAWGCISLGRITTYHGGITVYCYGNTPSTAFQVQISGVQ